MKRLPVLLLATCLLTGCVNSTRVTKLTMSTVDAPLRTIDLAEYERIHVGHNGVWLEVERKLEHVGGKAESDLELFGARPWRFYSVTHAALLLLNPKDENLDHYSLTLPGSASRLEKFYLRITYPDGQIKSFGLQDLVDSHKSGESVTKRLAYPNVTRGMIVEFEEELSSSHPPLRHNIPLQYDLPIEKLLVSYSYPDWWQVQVKQAGPDQRLPLETIDDPKHHKKTMRYTASSVPAVANEPFAPPLERQARRLQFHVTQCHMGGTMWSTAKSWDGATFELYEFMHPKHDSRDAKSLERAARKSVGNIIPAGAGEPERFRSIVAFLQDSIQVDDASRRKMHEVMREKKGDIFAITGIARAMLQEAGIEAHVALLHSEDDGYFDPAYVDLNDLSTPAVLATVDRSQVLAFPYLPLPPGSIPPNFLNQPAMVLGSGRFLSIDFPGVLGIAIEEHHSLSIGDTGKINGSVTLTFNELMSYQLRHELAGISEERKQKFVEALLPYEDDDIVKVANFEILDAKDEKRPLSIRLTHEIENMVTVTPEEMLFHTGGLFAPASADQFHVVEVGERQAPVYLPLAFTSKKIIEIRLPGGWTIAKVPEAVAFENEFGSITGKYTLDGERLLVEQDLQLHRIHAPKERFDQFVELSGSKSKLFIPTLVLHPTAASAE